MPRPVLQSPGSRNQLLRSTRLTCQTVVNMGTQPDVGLTAGVWAAEQRAWSEPLEGAQPEFSPLYISHALA